VANGQQADRLLLAAFLFSTVMSCGLIAYDLVHSYHNLHRAAEATVSNLTLSLENFLRVHFSVADLALKQAAGDFQRTGGAPDGTALAFSRTLAALEQLVPHNAGVRGCNEQGEVVYGLSLPPGKPLSVAGRQFFAAAKDSDRLVFGLPLKSRVTGDWVMPMARALRRPDGAFAGVVYLNTSLTAIAAVFRGIQTGDYGSVVLIDAERRVYLRLPSQPWVGDEVVIRLEAPETRQMLAEGRTEAVYHAVSSVDGRKKIVGLRRIGDYPLYVLVSLAKEEVFAGWWLDARNNLLVLLLSGAVGGALYLALMRSLRQREAALTSLKHKEAQLEQTVEQLSASQASFRTLAEGLPEMTWVIERGGQTRFLCNKWAEFSGISLPRLIEQGGWSSLVHPQDREPVDQAWTQAEAGEQDYQVKCRIRNAAGQWRTFDVRGLPQVGADGRLVAWIGSHFDISERELTQSALAAAKEAAEAANRAKSLFLANMSHEIRTPLNAIIGLTHLIRSDHPEPRHTARLEKINAAAAHLLSVINDILDISKIEADKLELEEEDFSLADLLDQVRSMVAEPAAAKGLTLAIGVDGVPPVLRGDVVRLRQGLLNYTFNALKFTERGGITLRAQLLEQGAQRVRVRFEVEDSGIGIAPEVLPRLFHKFEQAEAGSGRGYGGTGLGLALTRHLARLMGGDAGCTSEPGLGSVFWFTVILQHGRGHGPAERLQQALDPRQLILDSHPGATVLLAEDNAVNREVAVELLCGAGLRVEVALNGREAVEMAGARVYDLVLLDVQMPVMDGLKAARLIRALPGWSTRPILALTANAFADDRAACREAGMDDFISKPVDPKALYAVVLKWLSAAAGPLS